MDNYDLFQERLNTSTKIPQEKLIADKVKTFKRALNSSYNAETVYNQNNSDFLALISGTNSQKLQDNERKIFSTLLDNECAVGDIIFWERDNSRWMITEQTTTEKAVFQGFINKVNYQLEWKDLNTGTIYKQWVVAETSAEKTIEDGVKNSITYDLFSDSLFIMMPKKTKGVELLKRYDEIIIGGKKWIIEVVDNISNTNILKLYVKETALNRDLDTATLANGNVEVIFTFTSALDNIEEIEVDKTIVLNPVLFKNDEIQDLNYLIKVSNCINTNGVITFNNTGTAIITISYPTVNKSYKYIINVVETSAEIVSNTFILGSSTLKTLNIATYSFINIINGEQVSLDGVWEIDTNYLTTVTSDSDNLQIKAKNKTGLTTIKYKYNEQEYTKEIKIIPMFGGS